MLVCWAPLRSAPIGKKHATAPEFQPPACCAFPVAPVWFMADSDKRGFDGHVTERSWLGKGDRVISRARSINWGASGACVRLDKRDLNAQRSTLNAQRSTPNAQYSRCMDGGVSEVIALPRVMRCSREGRRGKGEQVVGRGRKSREFSRGLEFETRSDSYAPPKRGARCR